MRKFLLWAAIGAAVFGAGFGAEAAPAWKCKKRHCFWVEGYTGPVPAYARAWGPPSCPGGYYVLSRITKKWREACP